MDSTSASLPCLTYVADLLTLLRGAGVTRFDVPGLLGIQFSPPDQAYRFLTQPPGAAVPLPEGADLEETHQDRPLTPEEQAVARRRAAARARVRTWDDPLLWADHGGQKPTFGGGEDR